MCILSCDRSASNRYRSNLFLNYFYKNCRIRGRVLMNGPCVHILYWMEYRSQRWFLSTVVWHVKNYSTGCISIGWRGGGGWFLSGNNNIHFQIIGSRKVDIWLTCMTIREHIRLYFLFLLYYMSSFGRILSSYSEYTHHAAEFKR